MTNAMAIAAACLGISLAFGPPTADAARIKCWKNKDGVRECGNSVPPEYAQQGHEERSTGGFMLRRQDKARDKSEVEAERLAKLEQERVEKQEQRRMDARAAKDRVLLDTFVSEQDMELAHRQKTDAIAQRVTHSRDHISRLEETLGAMQAQAANLERAGKKVPEKLVADINEVQRQIGETETFIQARGVERAALDAQHQVDLQRFRYLKAGGPIGSEKKG